MRTALMLLLVSGAALADDAALLRCRALPDGPQRLACYNAIVVAPAGSGPAVGANAGAPFAAPAQAPSRAQLEQAFGKEPPALQAMRLASLTTRVAGRFDGWVANQTIRLANGQLWRVVDGSDDVLDADSPAATLQRGLLGAIYLDIDGAHRRPRVQRVE
ncbi:hypothetical protein [Rugamonas rubra]|uniref:Uncharacterized protein n=1 Tax=Rugamonas rubra TaxID=758825 RepID=A0A1I4U7G4_9BURK|nr:hypothetical protein [Rugamonas rubra]SFM84918.1 hypothetical protein SAMN02982985_05520 [Rugamonas rubra]